MHKLSDTIERKFIDSFDLNDKWEIESDEGWVPITQIHKTIPYTEWIIRTKNNELICADTHILFDENLNEIFAKDLIPNKSFIMCKDGPELVIEVIETNKKSNMYDITVDSDNHRFYSNNILSHNSQTTIAYVLWSSLFKNDQNIAILANKGSLARDLLDRYQRAYENLPKWLQQGVVVWNKGNIELENGSKVVAAATSSSAIRGGSFTHCVTGDTKITILDDYGRIFIDEIKNANSPKYKYDKDYNIESENFMFYTIYKTTNLVNNKEYIGYHQTNNLDDGYIGSGKLLKRAIVKYGIENFKKEYIKIFDNKEEAEKFESELVNKEYTLREDTYNISLGGNVCIMVGKNNPFYKKCHSPELMEQIRQKNIGKNQRKEDDIIIDDVRYNSFQHAKISLQLTNKQLIHKILERNNGYVDETLQNKLLNIVESKQKKIIQNRLNSSERMKQKMQNYTPSDEIKQKISSSLKGKKKTEEHINKINKNPEKIRKTAEKHKGMKRTKETRQKISQAKKNKPPHNKGKVWCHNLILCQQKQYFINEIPEKWQLGKLPKNH